MLSFHVKFVQTDGWTDWQTVKQYAHDLSIRWHKNDLMIDYTNDICLWLGNNIVKIGKSLEDLKILLD